MCSGFGACFNKFLIKKPNRLHFQKNCNFQISIEAIHSRCDNGRELFNWCAYFFAFIIIPSFGELVLVCVFGTHSCVSIRFCMSRRFNNICVYVNICILYIKHSRCTSTYAEAIHSVIFRLLYFNWEIENRRPKPCCSLKNLQIC